jgi:hypothetical protein
MAVQSSPASTVWFKTQPPDCVVCYVCNRLAPPAGCVKDSSDSATVMGVCTGCCRSMTPAQIWCLLVLLTGVLGCKQLHGSDW